MLPTMIKLRNLPNMVDEFFGREMMKEFFDEAPLVNIYENAEAFRLEVAAPGLEKSDFKIDLDNLVLTISADKEVKSEEVPDKVVRREFSYNRFKRTFTLPRSVNIDGIVANHANGILSINIPKREEAKVKPARSINVE